MAAEAMDVERYFARALHRVDVKERASRLGYFANFLDGLKNAGLVVGQHHADQSRLRAQRALNRRRVDQAARGGRDKGSLHSERGHALRRCQYCRMLNRRRHEVIAGAQQAEDRGIVALGAAGVEDHFGVVAVEELGQSGAGSVHGGVRLLSVEVNRAGVAEALDPVRAHRLHHLRQQRSGGVGVHVDSRHRRAAPDSIVREPKFRADGRAGRCSVPPKPERIKRQVPRLRFASFLMNKTG